MYKWIFLLGLLIAEVIRFPHRMRIKREHRENKIADQRTRPVDMVLDFTVFAGLEIVPLFYLFTNWLDGFNYQLPDWAGGIGSILFGASLLILWYAHRALGRNWSPTVEIGQGQSLVTNGIYQYIRHPIYAMMWLWVIAQPLLLQNWLAGFLGLVTLIPLYFIRVPREEQMMVDHFGDEYKQYMARTGGVIPRLQAMVQIIRSI